MSKTDASFRLGRGTIFAALTTIAMAQPQPASSNDRPGTPNRQVLSNCSEHDYTSYRPKLCGAFANTASEEVRFEMEATRNQVNVSLGNLDCPPDHSICYSPPNKYQRTSKSDPNIVMGFQTAGLDFGVEYCVRFRARRTSDDVVSELWSNMACVKTENQPPPPTRPDFSVQFFGTQWLTNPRLQIPQTMQVNYPTERGGAVTLDINILVPKADEPSSRPLVLGQNGVRVDLGGTGRNYQYKIDPNHPVVNIQMCAQNFSGRTCNMKLYNVQTQTQVTLPNAAAPVVRPAPVVQRPSPHPVIVATGHPTPALNEAFMVGIDMPGADYRNSALNDDDANSCRDICGKDATCKAWTWVKPGVQNAKAMCWLKNAISPSHPNPNATSGIKVTSTAVH